MYFSGRRGNFRRTACLQNFAKVSLHAPSIFTSLFLEKLNGQPGVVASATIWLFFVSIQTSG
jgi:hypothetical protein